ncbi:MAG: acyltransferase family protein [Pseudomonadota bacterium]
MKIDSHLPGPGIAGASALPHPAYRPDIDGLRAVAVLAVVVFHAFPAFFRGGFIGVDIFFVISGFLISSILLQALAQGSFSFRQFYARRIKRIFPALLLVLAGCLAFGWFAMFPDELSLLSTHVIGGAGFLSNIQFWFEVGYFDKAAETKPLLHLWSLGIEEQFYIVWPIVLLAAWRWRMNMLAVTLGLAALSFLVNALGIAAHPIATFYSPAGRAWELLLGAALACLALRGGATPFGARVPPNAISAAGAVLLALGFAIITRSDPFPGWRALLPVLSYAQIVESQVPAPHIRAAMVALALVLATLTYLLVERPLRRRPGPRRVAVLSGLMLGTVGVAAVLVLLDGAPQRSAIVESKANQQALVTYEDKDNAAACKKRFGFDSLYEYCLMADARKDPTVALIGDSHAYHITYGLMQYYSAQGDNLVNFGTRLPFWKLPVPPLDEYQKATQPMLELALATPSIRTVILTTAIRLHRANPEGVAIVEAARETIRQFQAAGKKVIWIDDVPHLFFDPRSCIRRPGIASSATRNPCAVTLDVVNKHNGEHPGVIADLMREFPAVELFQPARFLCGERYCHAMREGRLMYRDMHHLSYDGDLYIGKKFAERPKHP